MSKEDPEKEIHFKNALSNYSEVVQILDEWEGKVEHNYNAPVPDNWEQDPIVLLGEYLKILELKEQEKKMVRDNQLELIERCGVEEVWGARRRYAAEIKYWVFMNAKVRSEIKILIAGKIEAKLTNYASETEYMPFFESIFDKKTILTASIMQSLYTSFGMSIYEQMAIILSNNAGYKAQRQYCLLGSIDKETESLISSICNDRSHKHDKLSEIAAIRKSSKPGVANRDPESIVDVFVVNDKGEEIYVDITTVKPNIKEFRALKRKMLRWCALRFSISPTAKVKTFIGIPYNPYHPNKYERWQEHYDPKGDIRVQNDLWAEFAGYDVFDELIEVFKELGEDLKQKIADFFQNQANKK